MNCAKILPLILLATVSFSLWGQECPYNKKKLDKAEALKNGLLSDLQKDFDALSKADKECLYKSSQDPERIKAALAAISEQYVPDIKYVAGMTFGGRKVKCTENFSNFKYHLDTEVMSDVSLMFEIVNVSDFIDPKTANVKASFYDTTAKLKDRLPIKGSSSSDMGTYVNTSMSECFVDTMASSQLLQQILNSSTASSSGTSIGDSTTSASYQSLRAQVEADALKCISERIYGGPNYIGKTIDSNNLLQSKVQSEWVYGCSEIENAESGITSITENLAETALIKKKRELYNQNLVSLYSTLNNLLAGVEQNNECTTSQNIRNLIASSASIGIDFLTMNSTPAVIALSQLGAVVVNRVINWGAYLFGDGRSQTDVLKEALKTLSPDKNKEIFKRYACHLWSINGLGCEIETRKKLEPYAALSCDVASTDQGITEVLNSVTRIEKVLSPFAATASGTVPDLTNDAMGELTSFFYKRVTENKDGKEKLVRDSLGRPVYQPTDLYNKFFGGDGAVVNSLLAKEDENVFATQFSNASSTYGGLQSFVNRLNPSALYKAQDEAIDKEEKTKGAPVDDLRKREIQQAEFKKYVSDIQSSYKLMKKDFGDIQQGALKDLSPLRYVLSKYQENMLNDASPAEKPLYLNMLYKTISDQYVSSKEQTVITDNLVMASNALQTIEDVNNSLLLTEFNGNFKDDVSEKIASLQAIGNKRKKDGEIDKFQNLPTLLKNDNTIFEQLVYPVLQDCLMSYQFGVLWGKDKTQKYPFTREYLRKCEPLMGQCFKRYNIPPIGKDVRLPHFADPTIVDRPYCKVIKNYDEFISGVADEYRKTGKVCNVDPLQAYQGYK